MSSESDSSLTPTRTPGRQPSRRQALTRRSTKGPLDGDDPLAVESEPKSEPESEQKISQDAIRPEDKPLPSSPTSRAVSPRPEPQVTIIDRPAKNFSYLLRPDNFLPLNQQDVSTPFQVDVKKQASETSLSDLLSSGHFRAAAVLAANQLKSEPDPTNHIRIFSLLYTRLVCLQLLGLEYQAAQEAKALQDLNAPFYRDRPNGRHLVPWELRVLAVRLHAVGFGDWRRGIMGYYDLAREARFEFRRAAPEQDELWEDRLQDLGVRVGNALIEIGDLEGAVRHLQSLAIEASTSQLVRMRLGLTFLRCGNIEAARSCLGPSNQNTAHDDKMLAALCTMAEGNFDDAIGLWENLRASNADADFLAVAAQNQALCLVYVGRIFEAQELLDGLIDHHGHVHAITFNLSTIYELCSENSRELKLQLAERIATQEASSIGLEKSNADFKL